MLRTNRVENAEEQRNGVTKRLGRNLRFLALVNNLARLCILKIKPSHTLTSDTGASALRLSARLLSLRNYSAEDITYQARHELIGPFEAGMTYSSKLPLTGQSI